jgi:hypothetical protein
MPCDDHLKAGYEDRFHDANDDIEFLEDDDEFDVADERGFLEDEDDFDEQVDSDDEVSLGIVDLLVARDVIAHYKLAGSLDPRDSEDSDFED